jgi:hypothetical protein
MANNRDRAVPNEVTTDAKAVEVFRACVANGGLVCALCPTTWKDSATWGIVLADAARHIANAIRDERGQEPAITVAEIREIFNRELSEPTDEPKGRFIEQ